MKNGKSKGFTCFLGIVVAQAAKPSATAVHLTPIFLLLTL
jgi:hypothetical protein